MMPKNRRKLFRSKGDITLILIIIVILLFIIGGKVLQGLSPVGEEGKLILVTPTQDPSHTSLQLRSVAFITVPPTPKPTPIAIPADCGAGINNLLVQKGVKREPEVVYAYAPTVVVTGGKVDVWYHDEHSMTLGAGKIPVMKNFPVDSVFPSNPGVGVGDQAMRDPVGFFVFPSLYLLDRTTNPSGQPLDAINSGIAHIPDRVYGTWKPYNSGGDPTPNHELLPPGADKFPARGSVSCGSGNICNFGANVQWGVSNLNLTKGHSYLAVFVIHDGDNSSNGSDIGVACVTIQN